MTIMNPNCLKLLHAVFLLLPLQVQFLVLAASWKNTDANISCMENERQALLELKQLLVDESGCLSSWGKDIDCCKWNRIQCNKETGHVEKLDLHACDREQQPLRGEISASLINLPHLNYLDLSWNDFGGKEIPEFIGSLTNLRYLNLSCASFGGKIPYQLGNLSSLKGLDLYDNNLVGIIPYQLGNLSRLENLILGHNDYLIIDVEFFSHLSSLKVLELNGVRTLNKSKYWLQMVGQLPMLEELTLANCSLSDMDLLFLTPSQSNFSKALTYLDLSFNEFKSSMFAWLLNLNCNLTDLNLEGNLLDGPIPYDFFIRMKSLQYLDLSNNSLNGTIPKNIGLLSELEFLDVSLNSLAGVITDIHFANLTNLKVLALSANPFNLKFGNDWIPPFQLEALLVSFCKLGPAFPNWLQTQNTLRVLDVSHTDISDNAAEASFLCTDRRACEALVFLNMSNNQLSGHLPKCWSNWKSLKVLDLSNNEFSGSIPSSMDSLVMIQQIILRNNQLTGELPSLSTCSDLRKLDVGDNKLSGPIPSWIGSRLQRLEVLDLGKNLFDGILPLTLCQLISIRVLDLSQNKLSGVIPECIKNFSAMCKKSDLGVTRDTIYFVVNNVQYRMAYDNYLTVKWKGRVLQFKDNKRLLKSIDTSSNQMSGKIPKEIENLVELVSLNLSRNNFSGEIPSEFGKLQSLQAVDLSRNHFSGRIPSSLSNIDGLGFLNLSFNNLSGKIPTGIHLQTFDATSFEGNDFLCGRPLEITCPEDKVFKDPSVTTKQDEDHEDSLFTQGFYISMGLGFFTGIWGIFGSLLLFRSWRHAYFHFVNNLMESICVMTIIYLARCRRWLNV